MECKKKMNNSSKKIVEFFFGKLEENIIKNEVKAEGVSSFIMVVSEYWDFLNQEKWRHYLYNLLVLVRDRVEKNFEYIMDTGIGELLEILYATKMVCKKTGTFEKFYNSLKEIAYQIFVEFMNRCEKELKIRELRVEQYDLINGASGIGMYYLSRDNLNTKEKKLVKRICKYLIHIHYSYRQKGEGWVIKCKNQIREEDKVIFPEGSIDFGMAHGIIGVALFLSKAYSSGIIEQKQEEVIKEILQIYEKVKKQGIDGRYMYPSQLSKQQFVNREWDYDIRNNRMSWCYGTIGILRAQFLIGEYINNCKITNYCVKEIMKITHVDIKNYKLESPIICHGYAGVAVILDAFNRKLKCKQIEKRVEELMNIVYGFFNPKTNYGYMDRGIVNVGGETYYEEVEQFDLFSGSAGIILAIAAIMNVGVMWEERIFVIK